MPKFCEKCVARLCQNECSRDAGLAWELVFVKPLIHRQKQIDLEVGVPAGPIPSDNDQFILPPFHETLAKRLHQNPSEIRPNQSFKNIGENAQIFVPTVQFNDAQTTYCLKLAQLLNHCTKTETEDLFNADTYW
uniref:Uncharacterized protein n=1 Tax=Romanomermis culicivorax TaxID=13658 RepID=A0A915IH21_ROMCU